MENCVISFTKRVDLQFYFDLALNFKRKISSLFKKFLDFYGNFLFYFWRTHGIFFCVFLLLLRIEIYSKKKTNENNRLFILFTLLLSRLQSIFVFIWNFSQLVEILKFYSKNYQKRLHIINLYIFIILRIRTFIKNFIILIILNYFKK